MLLSRWRVHVGRWSLEIRLHLQHQGADPHEEVRNLMQHVSRCHGGTVSTAPNESYMLLCPAILTVVKTVNLSSF